MEDKALVEEGLIPAKCLYTIRKGEPVRDNITGKIVYARKDMIKIKGRKNGWTCHFYDEGGKGCSVYESRPLECRLLNCRDTSALENVFGKNLLVRKDLISAVGGLWDLVLEHDQRCSFDEIKKMIDGRKEDEETYFSGKAAELVEYDRIVRELVVKKGALDPELLDFLFGRPLSLVVSKYFSYLKPEETVT
jgi:Fe-S-cluster containining protein